MNKNYLIFGIIFLLSLSYASAISDEGGNITYTSDGYIIHTFYTSGTYISHNNHNVEVLIVGGGGAGGFHNGGGVGGGGGAGGLIYTASTNISDGSYSVIVGLGGINTTTQGLNGSDSIFLGSIAVGGGGGGTYQGNGRNGGSGGGAGQEGTIGGVGVLGQGFSGGNSSGSIGGTGGGGANQSGQNGTSASSYGGYGGAGKCYNFTGLVSCYAGGGGGAVHSVNGTVSGVGGSGVGGNGSIQALGILATQGLNGTGSGGGGAGGTSVVGHGGRGGSGVVIVKYKLSPSVSFTSNTTANNSIKYIDNNFIYMETSLTNIVSYNYTSLNIFNDSGSLVRSYNSTQNISNFNFTNLDVGRYYFNATSYNTTDSFYTLTYSVLIYNLTNGLFTNPISNYNLSSNNLSITWSNATSTFNASNITYYNITLLNSTGGFNRSLFSGLANNFSWSNIYGLNLSTGAYRLGLVAFDSNNNSVNSYSIPFNILTNSLLNVTSNVIANISLNGQSCISNYCNLNVIRGNNYSLIVNNDSYAYYSTIVNITNVAYATWNVSLLPNNALNISIINELTGSIINSLNTSITFNGALTYSINGTGVISGLNSQNYSLLVSNPSYSVKNYYVEVRDRSFTNINFYLSNGTATLFNFRTSSGAVITNALLRVYSYVNGSLVLVESGISDVSGRVQISARANTYYLFIASASGYSDYSFVLNPVLFNSYDIALFTSGGISIVPSAQVIYAPTLYFQNMRTNFTISFYSPYGSLDEYTYSVSYYNGSISGSGSNARGQNFSNNLIIPKSPADSQVVVNYWYNLTNGYTKNFSATYILPVTYSNHTLVSMGQDNFGLLVGDRIWVFVWITLPIVGLAFVFSSSLTFALIILAFMSGIFSANNFIPSSVGVGIIVLVILYLIGKGSS